MFPTKFYACIWQGERICQICTGERSYDAQLILYYYLFLGIQHCNLVIWSVNLLYGKAE
jgi:hypothetical protein